MEELLFAAVILVLDPAHEVLPNHFFLFVAHAGEFDSIVLLVGFFSILLKKLSFWLQILSQIVLVFV